jgi:hypothetical protein
MAAKKRINKTERREGDRLLAQGIQQKSLNLAIVVANTPYTGQQVVDMLTKRISLGDATDSAHRAWIGAAEAETSYVKQTQPVINAVKRQLRTQYGKDSTALGAYGLTPQATTTPTTAVKAEAIKKRQATKAAGGKKAEKKAAQAAAAAAVPPVPAANQQQAPTGGKQQ